MVFSLFISKEYDIEDIYDFISNTLKSSYNAIKSFNISDVIEDKHGYHISVSTSLTTKQEVCIALSKLFSDYGVSLKEYQKYFSVCFDDESNQDDGNSKFCSYTVYLRIIKDSTEINIYNAIKYLKNHITAEPKKVLIRVLSESNNNAELKVYNVPQSDFLFMLQKATKMSDNELKENLVINFRDVKSSTDALTEANGSEDNVKNVLQKIHALQGADEFKDYCEELHRRADVIKEHQTQSIFLSTILVFYTNPSNGFKVSVELLGELLDAENILSLESISFTEHIVSRDSEELKRLIHSVKTAWHRNRIYVFNITKWIENTEAKDFKEFLSVIREVKGSLIIFRSDLVSKNEINKTNKDLSDILPIRPIVIKDLTNKELHIIASGILQKYNYELSDTASMLFDQKMDQEREDGYFYGVNTVEKVIVELINAAETGNDPKNTCISEEVLKSMLVKKDKRTAQELFNSLYGLEKVKAQLTEAIDQIKFVRNSKKDIAAPTMHMKFLGAPGTGKTTVARILGKALKEEGLLEKGNIVECRGRDLCGQYIGHTAMLTKEFCKKAYGSVLFIDEAYSLYKGKDNERDYGKEAVVTLMTEMENHPNDLLVIFAGYEDEMDKLMEANSGLSSRLPFSIKFDNYTGEELYYIFEKMAKKDFECEDALFEIAKEFFTTLPKEIMDGEFFGNARFVRNIYEATWRKAVGRCHNLPPESVKLTVDDFNKATEEQKVKEKTDSKTKIGF